MKHAASASIAWMLSLLAAWAGTPGGLPPEGAVHPGEWEDMQAQVMSWPFGSPDLVDFFSELVDHIQEYNEIWMMVNNQAQQDQVEDALTTRGVPLTNVIFLHEAVDSIWSRDYGPNYLRTALGEARITDARYYVLRWNDDVTPYRIGAWKDIPMHEAHLDLEGGNFQSDGHGHCFYTERIYDNNSGMTPVEIDAIMRDYFGCTETTAVYDIPDEGTGHIDMFAKLLSPTTWMVGQYPGGDPNRQVLEDNAALLTGLTAHNGDPYEVVRIPMPTTAASALTIDYGDLLPAYDDAGSGITAGEVWRTHTNSTIADDLVLVPTYGKGTDVEALAIYAAAMPDHTIVGVDSEAIIPLNGAIHCVTMQVPAYPPYTGLALDGIQDLAEVVGNGDASIDPGETWEFRAVLENRGTVTAEGITARLVPNVTVAGAADMLRDASGYDDIGGGSTGASRETYRVALATSYPCGLPLRFDLVEVTSSLGPDPDQPCALSLVVGDETVVTRFQDDMESGEGGWTHAPWGAGTDLWHQETDPGCFAARSPTTQWSFVDGTDCEYLTGGQSAGTLTSASITGVTSDSTLSFGYWRETDFCTRFPLIPAVDFFQVLVSDDGFSTSSTLLDLSCKNPSHAQWLADDPYDLSSYAGANIQVRFLFDSVDTGGNQWHGIGIDDVLVEDRSYSCGSFTPPLPGEVPESAQSPGEPLRVAKAGPDLVVSWDFGCNAGYDTDYGVYRGTLAALDGGTWDHTPVVCTDTEGDLEESIVAGAGSYYYLVVPHDGAVEGSYGSGEPGERPASTSACHPAGGGACP